MRTSSRQLKLTLFIVVSACGGLARGADEDTRAAVPEGPELEAATKLSRDVFGATYRAAQDDKSKSALAKKVLSTGLDPASQPVERYVLLRLAREMATIAGDTETALRSVEEMGRRFRVDAIQIKSDVFERVLGAPRPPAEHQAYLTPLVALYEEAVAAERFELARKLGRLATASASKARDTTARREIAAKLRTLDRLEQAFAAVKSGLDVLKQDPADPEANLVVGKHRCLTKDDWKTGLPMLALGSDPQLRALAELELANPTGESDQVKLGDAWWELANDMNGEERLPVLARAGFWYRQCVDQLDGLTKLRIAKRMEQLDAKTQATEPAGTTQQEKPQPIDVLRAIDIAKDTIQGQWRFERGGLLSPSRERDGIHLPFLPPAEYSLELVFTRLRGAHGPLIGLPGGGRSVIAVLDCDGGKRSGLERVDGRMLHDGNASGRPGKAVVTGRQTRITCHVHNSGVRVSVDGRLAVDWQGGFERLSLPERWAPKDRRLPFLGVWKSPCYFHSITLTPLSGPAEVVHPLE